MQKFTKLLSVLLVLALFAAFAVGSSSSDDATQADSDPSSANQEEAADGAVYELGEGSVVVSTDSIGTKWVTINVPVKNTGTTNLFIESATMDVENESGELEQTLSSVSGYPQVLQPGETAYYYESTTYDGTATENLKLIPHADIKEASVDCVRLDVSEIKIKDEEYVGTSVVGRVENTTTEDQEMVYVVANLFDKDGKFISQEFTILDNDLKAGEKVGFETTSLSDTFKAADVATYEVYAFPFQYQF